MEYAIYGVEVYPEYRCVLLTTFESYDDARSMLDFFSKRYEKIYDKVRIERCGFDDV